MGEAHNLLKTDGKQRTDASHVLGAVRLLNQLELIHEILRHALNILAEIVRDDFSVLRFAMSMAELVATIFSGHGQVVISPE